MVILWRDERGGPVEEACAGTSPERSGRSPFQLSVAKNNNKRIEDKGFKKKKKEPSQNRCGSGLICSRL